MYGSQDREITVRAWFELFFEENGDVDGKMVPGIIMLICDYCSSGWSNCVGHK